MYDCKHGKVLFCSYAQDTSECFNLRCYVKEPSDLERNVLIFGD